MKKTTIIKCLSVAMTFSILLIFACETVEKTYDNFTKYGERVYIGTPDSITVAHGFKKLEFTIGINADPKISSGVLETIDGSYTHSFDVERTNWDEDTVKFTVDLEPGEHDFQIILKDKAGNRSMPREISTVVYGENYVNKLISRNIKEINTYINANVVLEKPPKGVIYSILKYEDTSGTMHSIDIANDLNYIHMDNYKVGGKIEVTSLYKPTNAFENFSSKPYRDVFPKAISSARYNYLTFFNKQLHFGGGYTTPIDIKSFRLNDDVSKIKTIKMFVKLRCPEEGCDRWDRTALVEIKDSKTGIWYEMGRYITPYGIGNEKLERGFEYDVTDFKSLLEGTVELKISMGTFDSKGFLVSVDFDYIAGTPDYTNYAIGSVLGYNFVYYGKINYDPNLDRTITIPYNAESIHLRTIITGWGHANTLNPIDWREWGGCAEWCRRTHTIKINDKNTFEHYMDFLGCNNNPVSPQTGNWDLSRAGWCPGMAVPTRINKLNTELAGRTISFDYVFQDWTNAVQSDDFEKNASYYISTYIIVKSNSAIDSPTITD